MISYRVERRLLQATVALACTVPISAGLAGVTRGAQFLGGGSADMDSHMRYLSGLLMAIGFSFLLALRHIEERTMLTRMLTFIVFTGGLSRLLGIFLAETPGPQMQAAIGMELVVTPLLCLWQHRINRLSRRVRDLV